MRSIRIKDSNININYNRFLNAVLAILERGKSIAKYCRKNESIGIFLVIVIAFFIVSFKGGGGALMIDGKIFNNLPDPAYLSPGFLTASSAAIYENNSDFASSDDSNDYQSTLSVIQDTTLLARNYTLIDAVNSVANRGNKIIGYTVQEGDTLSSIAASFNVNIQSIVWANNIKNVNFIKPGMEMRIPPVSGVIHKVKSGDTVSGIAGQYDADSDDIISFNNLSDSANLYIGQEIIVPGGKITPRYIHSKSSSGYMRGNLRSADDYYIVPVPNAVKTQGLHGYYRNAVDLAAPCGTPIYAAASGIISDVRNSGYNRGYGLYVDIDHPNGTKTRYAHNSINLVSAGTWVKQGQMIARMGTTGHSTGCHVHYEVHGVLHPLR